MSQKRADTVQLDFETINPGFDRDPWFRLCEITKSQPRIPGECLLIILKSRVSLTLEPYLDLTFERGPTPKRRPLIPTPLPNAAQDISK